MVRADAPDRALCAWLTCMCGRSALALLQAACDAPGALSGFLVPADLLSPFVASLLSLASTLVGTKRRTLSMFADDADGDSGDDDASN